MVLSASWNHAERMLYLGADHNGYERKEALKRFLERADIPFHDLGPHAFDPADDYPDYANRVADQVHHNRKAMGVLICGSGNGMAMAANRHPNIRAALCLAPVHAKKAREDENANILVLSSWWTTLPVTQRILRAWLSTPFQPKAHHIRRIRKISRHGRA